MMPTDTPRAATETPENFGAVASPGEKVSEVSFPRELRVQDEAQIASRLMKRKGLSIHS